MVSEPRFAVRSAIPTRGPWLPLAAATVAVVFVLAAARLILHAEHTTGWGFDFRAYYAAALRLVASGTPYQLETLIGPFRPGPAGLYLYTPAPALLVEPFTWLGPDVAVFAWLVVRMALVVATCLLMPVPRWVKLAALAVAVVSAQFLYDLDLGNVSLIVTFFAVVAWRWLDKPLSGISIAAALTIRPAMGVVWLWWIARRQWTAVAWTVLGFAAVVLASLPFLGVDPWLQYVIVLRHVSDVVGVANNLDLGSTALGLGFPEPVANLFLVGGYALAITAIVFGLRRDREIGFAITLMATLLLSPLLWDHYLTNLIVPGALLAARGRRWGVLLPLLGWLPLELLPIAAICGMFLPFLAQDQGEAALDLARHQTEPVANVDASPSGTAGA